VAVSSTATVARVRPDPAVLPPFTTRGRTGARYRIGRPDRGAFRTCRASFVRSSLDQDTYSDKEARKFASRISSRAAGFLKCQFWAPPTAVPLSRWIGGGTDRRFMAPVDSSRDKRKGSSAVRNLVAVVLTTVGISTATAQYKCVGKDGAVTFQQQACATQATQQKLEVRSTHHRRLLPRRRPSSPMSVGQRDGGRSAQARPAN
jgi:hypothetical protein